MKSLLFFLALTTSALAQSDDLRIHPPWETPTPSPTPTPYPTPTPTPSPPPPTPTPTPRPTPTPPPHVLPTPPPVVVPTPSPVPGGTPASSPSPSPTPRPSPTPVAKVYLHPVNQTMAINELRDFAMANGAESTVIAPENQSYTKEHTAFSKDGKDIAPRSVEQRIIQRWGIWSSFDYFGNGKNLYQGSAGIDYRIAPHWLIGASGRVGYLSGHAGVSLYQGGLYTAFYSNGLWGVAGGLAGPSQYTVYAGLGYDFRFGNFVAGPVVNGQWDDVTSSQYGFGRGNVEQVRVGGRIGYVAGRLQPWAQVMYQRQESSNNNNDPLRENALWAGAGVNFILSERWMLWAGYAFEGNENYQLNQGTLGVRCQF